MLNAFAAGWCYSAAMNFVSEEKYGFGICMLLLGIVNTVFCFI